MNQRGFTLVEMLVALSVFALLSVAGVSVMAYAVRESEPLAEATGKLKEIQIARAILRSDLGQIAARPVRSVFGDAQGVGMRGGIATGNGALMTFVRRGWVNPAGTERRSSLQYVSYAVVDGDLRRISRPFLDPTSDTPEETVTLIRGASRVQVTFFDNGQWSDQWIARDGGHYLPAVVSIEAEVDGIGHLRQLFVTPGAS